MRNRQFTNTTACRAYLIAVAMLLVSGCAATIELASPEEDVAAKLFAAPEGKANLYVTRKDQFTGSAVLFQVVVDGRVEGGLAPGTYRMITVEPGRHIVSVTTAENQSTQKIDAVAGKCYFFEVKPKIGMIAARVEVIPLSEPDGQKAVAQNSLAEGFQFDTG
ncbi:MAG: DUF2846 domain-containing protein [Gammaproteobacteria bacterium]|nr:DUF2846 domain-containing protein [Gammaproteobacteria bacterium]